MTSGRSSHINQLQANTSLIFGPEFDQTWFPSKFNRGSIEKFQYLLGAQMTPEGKKYPLLPPILFPDGPQNKKDVFLNPALVRVRIFSCDTFTTQYTEECTGTKGYLVQSCCRTWWGKKAKVYWWDQYYYILQKKVPTVTNTATFNKSLVACRKQNPLWSQALWD